MVVVLWSADVVYTHSQEFVALYSTREREREREGLGLGLGLGLGRGTHFKSELLYYFTTLHSRYPRALTLLLYYFTTLLLCIVSILGR